MAISDPGSHTEDGGLVVPHVDNTARHPAHSFGGHFNPHAPTRRVDVVLRFAVVCFVDIVGLVVCVAVELAHVEALLSILLLEGLLPEGGCELEDAARRPGRQEAQQVAEVGPGLDASRATPTTTPGRPAAS